ncbi:MAG: hypothetical protein PUE80_02535 [bacterium]|nr:hypothetical protein [bacterium]
MGGYQTELPGTDPLQGSSPSHSIHTQALTAIPPATVGIHDSVRQAKAVFFFRRSRLFFREAAFFSGGEGCEWGAKQSTVGKSGDKAENEFSGFIPLAVPRKGFSPHIPASRLFVHFHTTSPHPHQIPHPSTRLNLFNLLGLLGLLGL